MPTISRAMTWLQWKARQGGERALGVRPGRWNKSEPPREHCRPAFRPALPPGIAYAAGGQTCLPEKGKGPEEPSAQKHRLQLPHRNSSARGFSEFSTDTEQGVAAAGQGWAAVCRDTSPLGIPLLSEPQPGERNGGRSLVSGINLAPTPIHTRPPRVCSPGRGLAHSGLLAWCRGMGGGRGVR